MAKGPSPRKGSSGENPRGGPRPGGPGAGGPAPWLDEADYIDESPIRTLVGRRFLIGVLVVAAILVAAIVVGVMTIRRQDAGPIDIPAPGAPVPVLRADGPWKVRPTGPDAEGIPVEGQGQTLYGTGEGRPTSAEIDLGAVPEEPLPRPGESSASPDEGTIVTPLPSPGAAPKAAAPAATTAAPAPSAPAAHAAMPRVAQALGMTPAPQAPAAKSTAEAPASSAGNGGAPGQTIQLGAFSTTARARTAFEGLKARFPYLADMEPLIVPVESNGRTLYRLRANASSANAAADLCRRLKVAGEACSVVH